MDYISEQVELVNKIVNGKINRSGVERELKNMEEKYGKECFNSYPVKRKPKPWTKDDLKDLEILSSSGASSKEFYLYMAEVSDEVYKRNKLVVAGISIGAAVVVLAGIAVLISLTKH